MNPSPLVRPPVVADTNLFVAAGFNPDSDSACVLRAVRAGVLGLVWDEVTRRETEHVVGKIPPLRGTDLSEYFLPAGRYEGRTDPDTFDSIPDPADRKFAALAAATGAVLVTSDRHLLVGRPHPGVEVLTPGEFVERAGWRRSGRSDCSPAHLFPPSEETPKTLFETVRGAGRWERDRR